MQEEYKKYILSKGGKELGILEYDIKTHLLAPSKYEEFNEFMTGQTGGILETGNYEEPVTFIYVSDYLNFINGEKVTD